MPTNLPTNPPPASAPRPVTFTPAIMPTGQLGGQINTAHGSFAAGPGPSAVLTVPIPKGPTVTVSGNGGANPQVSAGFTFAFK